MNDIEKEIEGIEDNIEEIHNKEEDDIIKNNINRNREEDYYVCCYKYIVICTSGTYSFYCIR